MSTTQTQAIDTKTYIQQRNEAEHNRLNPPQVPIPAKPVEKLVEAKVEEAPKPAAPQENGHLSRSQRREMNRLREELGELRGQLKAYQQFAPAKPAETPAAKDEKPKREQFKSDAEFAGEMGAWAARQMVSKTYEERDYQKQLQEEIDEAQQALEVYKEQIGDEDWEQLIEDTKDFQFPGGATDVERILFATSGARVLVGKWLVDHPKDFDRLIELRGSEVKQRKFFANLEGKAEIAYTTSQKKKAAQAPDPEKEEKDRTHPAEAQAGRNAAVSEPTRLPRPTSDVSAPAGVAPPEAPKPGTAAWIAQRNAKFHPGR